MATKFKMAAFLLFFISWLQETFFFWQARYHAYTNPILSMQVKEVGVICTFSPRALINFVYSNKNQCCIVNLKCTESEMSSVFKLPRNWFEWIASLKFDASRRELDKLDN